MHAFTSRRLSIKKQSSYMHTCCMTNAIYCIIFMKSTQPWKYLDVIGFLLYD